MSNNAYLLFLLLTTVSSDAIFDCSATCPGKWPYGCAGSSDVYILLRCNNGECEYLKEGKKGNTNWCTYRDYDAEASSTTVTCSKGSYKTNREIDSGSSILCTKCPEGQYSDTTDASTCKGCDPGRYSYTLGRSSPCFGCPLGKYKKEVTFTRTDSTSCKYCPTGYAAGSQGSAECSQCEPGLYNDQSGFAFGVLCKSCSEGKANVKFGSTSIDDCISCLQGVSLIIETNSDY